MDQIKENASVNGVEVKSGQIKLSSTPQYVTIGAHYKCNSNCVFCLGGEFPDFSLELYKAFFEKKLEGVLNKADHIGFCGFGEILLLPEIMQFLDRINTTLYDSKKVFTTNGIALKPALCDKLSEGNYSILISLHAAEGNLHKFMTGSGHFDLIIKQIKYLKETKEKKNKNLHINLIFLLTTLNLHNLPDFVRLAQEIGADRVTCNYLTVFEPEQLKMSLFFKQDEANKVFCEAQDVADKLQMTLILPPVFGKKSTPVGKPACYDPWNFFYVETQGSVNPCCFAGNHIGYLDKEDFGSIWNGPGYTSLREGLVTGDIHTWCKHCYRYNPDNVNDIRSHITFRPETREKLLRYVQEINASDKR